VKQAGTRVLRKRLRLIVHGRYTIRSRRLAREEFLCTLKAGPAGGDTTVTGEPASPSHQG